MTNEEKVRAALTKVLCNVMNYPGTSGAQLWGRDLSKVIDKATAAVMESGTVEAVDDLYARPLVNRVEVIDASGRIYVNMDATEVVTALQDSGKTLKVFVGWEGQ